MALPAPLPAGRMSSLAHRTVLRGAIWQTDRACGTCRNDDWDVYVNGNATTVHRNVALLSIAASMPGRVTTSAEIDTALAPALKRMGLPRGLLERVAGITERRNWATGESFDTAAISAGEKALAEAGVAASDIGLMHNGLGLPSSAVNFDIANACLGFVNGMSLAAQLIDAGQIRYART